MNTELLIDSIKIITEKSQSSIEQVIRKDKPINERLKFVSLYLNEMKSEILEWICNILNKNINPKDLIKKLTELKRSTDDELAKSRLHILLKKKLKKLKNQSFMHSVDSHQNFFNEESRIQELEKSVLHIEKDLNIEPQQEDNLAISSIIQKNQSAVRDQHNISVMSQIQTFTINLSDKTEKKEVHEVKTTIQTNNFVIDGQEPKFQLSESLVRSRNVSEQSKTMKQNESKNIPEPILGQTKQKDQGQISRDKIAQGSKLVMKKKKKSVYSTTGQSGHMSKEDLLGNILQECLQNENK